MTDEAIKDLMEQADKLFYVEDQDLRFITTLPQGNVVLRTWYSSDALTALQERVRELEGALKMITDAEAAMGKSTALLPVPFCRACEKHVRLTAFGDGDELACAICEGDDWYLDNGSAALGVVPTESI